MFSHQTENHHLEHGWQWNMPLSNQSHSAFVYASNAHICMYGRYVKKCEDTRLTEFVGVVTWWGDILFL
jgi:hypothetical protein